MTQRQEIIERLRAVDLGGGSHESLSAIAKAVYEPAGGWTIVACEDLRDRLVRLLGGDAVQDRSITDELRERIDAVCRVSGWDCKRLTAIADRIDAEHERALSNVYTDKMDASGWVRLPKDADGEYIHVGDKVTCGASVWEVTGFRFTGGFWGICCTIFNDQGGSGTNVYPPSDLHHYHAPTVEDVLRDMHAKLDEVTALYVGEAIDSDERDSDEARIFAEYAKRLRLAGDAE